MALHSMEGSEMLNFIKRLIGTDKANDNPQPKPTKFQSKKYRNGGEKPPSKKQREECNVLGIPIKPDMSSRDVWKILKDAVEDPENRALLDEHYAHEYAIAEDDERHEYGNALIDELHRWEDLCIVSAHYLVTYKKGKTLKSDVMEFERVEIEEVQKPYVKIEALIPKVKRPKNELPWLEWDKEITLRPKQMHEFTKLPQQIHMDDVDGYERILEEAKVIELKYRQQ
jgi:hypothetical protein